MHTTTPVTARSQRPRALTVFGAAFVAGAAAAFGVNSVLDAHLAASRPQVESDSILVAIRAVPTGAPVTVWDVALKDWPKALVPAAAMRVTDGLEGLVARQPLREGQPILAVQVERLSPEENAAPRRDIVSVRTEPSPFPERDLWAPAETPVKKVEPSSPRERPAAPAIEPRSVAAVVAPPTTTTPDTPVTTTSDVAVAPSTPSVDEAPPAAAPAPTAAEPAVPPAVAVTTEPIAPAAEDLPETRPVGTVPPPAIAAVEPLSLPAAPPAEVSQAPATIEPEDTLPLAVGDAASAAAAGDPRPTSSGTGPGSPKRQRPASSRFRDVPAPEALAIDGASADPIPSPRRSGKGSTTEEVSVVDRRTGPDADRTSPASAPPRGVRQGEGAVKRPQAQAARRPPQPAPRSSGMSRGYRTR